MDVPWCTLVSLLPSKTEKVVSFKYDYYLFTSIVNK